MAFSLKKRVKSKLSISSVCDDDGNTLGEVLHRSTKTNKSKKNKRKENNLVSSDHTTSRDNEYLSGTRSLSADHHVIYRNQCPCETHYDKQLIEQNYSLTVDKLFDLLFGTNEFVRTYRQSQNIFDDTATEWTLNPETKCRERILNFKIPYESTLVGKSTITTREKQTIVQEVVGFHYIVEAEVFNQGVKFSDTFSLGMRYCLVQTSATNTHLCVTAQARFCKPVNGFIKQLIEKNTYSTSIECFKDLNNRLNLITDFTMKKRRLSRSELSLSIPITSNEHSRRMSRHDALSFVSLQQTISEDTRRLEVSSLSSPSPSHYPNIIMYFFILLAGCLLFIHLFLYSKLKNMDVLVDHLSNLVNTSSSISAREQ
ncbi:unnamed protein product [Adineta ricciae]|uniref:VASt domain-containing protein n=1 Tax=Adineta ricciae TaxID=249248 RepID=A0A813UIX6_ADIRI|nr:unnamed protein product [Adineta ricciae]CAF1000786.1 unnamed protein product [Adineta ricciae]